jgi:hypothetical protein
MANPEYLPQAKQPAIVHDYRWRASKPIFLQASIFAPATTGER